MIKLADNLSLPIEFVTQTASIIAKRRAGKSYLARRISEQLLRAKQQVVIIDPKGDQWGIRSSADGKQPGYPVIILGGEHGDVPLENGSGEVVAKLIVEERVSALLDLSFFRKGEVAQFMAIFLETVYRMKAKEQYRTPTMLIIDESDAIAPQRPFKGEERMLGACEDIVRRGGQRGIGCLLVTQRSAVLNKNVLTQSQCIIALRTIAPQDIAALDAWIEVHGSKEERATLLESIASLPIGDAWFWSPGWPHDTGIFKRIHVLEIETFDSGATPSGDKKKIEPKTVAEIDLDALKRQMSSTIERAKADDPRELKRQIGELKRQLKQPKVSIKSVDDKKLQTAVSKAVEQTTKHFRQEAARVVAFANTVKRQAEVLKHEAETLIVKLEVKPDTEVLKLSGMQQEPGTTKINLSRMTWEPGNKFKPGTFRITHNGDGDITGPEQRILNAIAWLNSIGIEEPNQTAACFLAGYTWGGGGFNNPRGSLHTKGLVEYLGSRIQLTDEGKKFAHVPDEILDAQQLQARVFSVLPGPERKILKPLIEAYPEPLTNEELAEASGYTEGGGGLNNPRGRLRTLGLIDYPSPGLAIASSLLFLE